MNHIFYIMGKSSTGKDTIYQRILYSNTQQMGDVCLKGFNPIIMYTTRPMRSGEIEGIQYHFINMETYEEMLKSDKILEERRYNTVNGLWIYFTSTDSIDLSKSNYIGMGTLESYKSLLNYYGKEVMIPIYIEIDEFERAFRALNREKNTNKDYNEMYRRLRQDLLDFSEENLKNVGIGEEDRYYNDNLDFCTYNIINKIYSVVCE